MSEQRFVYAPRTLPLVGAALAFATATGLFGWLGATDREVRMFPLPIYVHGAPVYVFALLSFGLVVAGTASLVASIHHGPRALVISDDWIEAPRSPLRRATKRIHRHEISHVDRFEVSGSRGVRIFATHGKLALGNRLVGDDGLAAVEKWLARGSG